KDKATGKQQSITIRASSGLSEDEINRMVKDAEAHAADDKKFHELVTARNHADALIHATRKSMAELGDKLDAAEKESVEAAIKELEEVMKGEDKDAIDAKTATLTQASGKIAERVYAQAQAAGEQPGGETGEAKTGAKEDVVDAEFEEVKDDKK
ncbi:MAG: Hsp70 family protein, partial [Thiohalomonadaceae bacterium]